MEPLLTIAPLTEDELVPMRMPVTEDEMLPELVIPPSTVLAESTSMPAPDDELILPLLLMPPPTVEEFETSIRPDSCPLLVIPPVTVEELTEILTTLRSIRT